MGNAYAHRRRMAPALILMAAALLIVLAFMAVSASIGAQAAQALPAFDTAVSGVGPCSSCHSATYGDAFHSKTTHAAQACGKCHTVNTATPPLPSACSSCHGSAATIIAGQTLHGSVGCGTTAGCHGAPSPTPTATSTGTPTPTPTATATAVATHVTAKVAPTTIKLHKTVKTTGAVTPVATLAGKKVALRVDFKKGTKWVKAKTASATVTKTGTYSWTYKPLKKGTFRLKASIAARAGVYKASQTTYRTFKVK